MRLRVTSQGDCLKAHAWQPLACRARPSLPTCMQRAQTASPALQCGADTQFGVCSGRTGSEGRPARRLQPRRARAPACRCRSARRARDQPAHGGLAGAAPGRVAGRHRQQRVSWAWRLGVVRKRLQMWSCQHAPTRALHSPVAMAPPTAKASSPEAPPNIGVTNSANPLAGPRHSSCLTFSTTWCGATPTTFTSCPGVLRPRSTRSIAQNGRALHA